jgi:hypothetical protein
VNILAEILAALVRFRAQHGCLPVEIGLHRADRNELVKETDNLRTLTGATPIKASIHRQDNTPAAMVECVVKRHEDTVLLEFEGVAIPVTVSLFTNRGGPSLIPPDEKAKGTT